MIGAPLVYREVMTTQPVAASRPEVTLRRVRGTDLEAFFEMERDPEANWMAAFTAKDPSDRVLFDARWALLLDDAQVTARTISADGLIAGSVMTYIEDGETEITYWIAREYWGAGVASKALALFLDEVTERPLNARTAKDNVGSLTVLKRCGFEIVGENEDFANGRGEMVQEHLLQLA